MKKKKTTDAVAILEKLFIKGDPARLAAIEAEREKIKIAEQVYALRTEQGLTQQQLADIMGTTQSVISRIESTDYESERLDTLQKLATALHCRLEVRFVSEAESTSMTGDKFEDASNNCIWFEGYRFGESCSWDLQEHDNYKFQRFG